MTVTRHRRLARALIAAFLFILITPALLARCERSAENAGRERARTASRLFREGAFIDAVAEYEQALAQVDDASIHFNLGLAYSKLFQPGLSSPTRLGVLGSFACEVIPRVIAIDVRVCIKEGDRKFDDCDNKHECSSSSTCTKTSVCALDSRLIADAAAEHFQIWLAANEDDRETRTLMSQIWIDSGQFGKALEYWEARLGNTPSDPEIMQTLAGINLKANDWRTSIAWYRRMASVARDVGAKIAASRATRARRAGK